MKKGFSLIEVMIALGVLAVASVGVMKISTNTAKVQKRAETFQNALSIEQRINYAVLNPDVCTASLTTNGPTIFEGKNISILDSNNIAIFTAGPNPIMNGTITINSIQVVNLTAPNPALEFTDPLVPGRRLNTRQATIEVNYSKSARTLNMPAANTYVKRTSPIDVIYDVANNNLENCRSPFNDAVEAAIGQICTELGGAYNQNSRMCESTNGTLDTVAADNSPVSPRGLPPSILDNRFVSREGDEIVGPNPFTIRGTSSLIADGTMTANNDLTANGASTFNGGLLANQGISMPANAPFCIGTNCITSLQRCQANEYLKGYLPNGMPDCQIIPTNECGPNQYVVSVTDGVAECDVLNETVQGSCEPHQELMGYNSDGTKDCRNKTCAEGESLDGYDSTGTPQCSGGADALAGLTFRSMYLTTDGSLTFTAPNSEDFDIELDNRRCSRTSRQCDAGRGVVCAAGFNVTNTRRYDRRQSALNRECRCSWTCAPDQAAPIEIAYRECTERLGNWRVTASPNSCNCPGFNSSTATAPASGTQPVSVTCVGDSCGSGCDAATRPENTRACTCYPCGIGSEGDPRCSGSGPGFEVE